MSQLEHDAVGGAYANALVEIASENNSLDDVHSDVDALQALFSENEQVKDFLYNPVMAEEKKRDVVKKISKEAGLSKYTTNFLNLLIDTDRIQAIEEILDAFEKTYCNLTDTQVRLAAFGTKCSWQPASCTSIWLTAAGFLCLCLVICDRSKEACCILDQMLMATCIMYKHLADSNWHLMPLLHCL